MSLFLNCLYIFSFSQELRQTKVYLHEGIMKYKKENCLSAVEQSAFE